MKKATGFRCLCELDPALGDNDLASPVHRISTY